VGQPLSRASRRRQREPRCRAERSRASAGLCFSRGVAASGLEVLYSSGTWGASPGLNGHGARGGAREGAWMAFGDLRVQPRPEVYFQQVDYGSGGFWSLFAVQ